MQPFSAEHISQLGSSVEVVIETISMKGIRRLNKPFVTVCVVDADGHLLAPEQAQHHTLVMV